MKGWATHTLNAIALNTLEGDECIYISADYFEVGNAAALMASRGGDYNRS